MTCEQPGREVYTLSGSAKQFDSFQGLPEAKIMGRFLKWPAAGCTEQD